MSAHWHTIAADRRMQAVHECGAAQTANLYKLLMPNALTRNLNAQYNHAQPMDWILLV
jgi:hypothetical protein